MRRHMCRQSLTNPPAQIESFRKGRTDPLEPFRDCVKNQRTRDRRYTPEECWR
jgi:hypothetical protein